MLRVVMIFLSLGFFAFSTTALAMPKIGQAAPDFVAVDSNGVAHKLADFAGKKVILEWFNKDCPFVRKHYDSKNMQQLQARYTAEGAVWLTVISSAPGKQGYVTAQEANADAKRLDQQATAILLDSDGEMGRAYQARTTPHIYLIDEKGILQYMGAIDSIRSANPADVAKAENYLVAAMTALSAGQTPKVTATAPYGCSVKY